MNAPAYNWKGFGYLRGGTVRMVPGMRMLFGKCAGCGYERNPLRICVIAMVVWVN